MAITTAFKKIGKTLYEPTFYKVIQGGMSGGKTYAIMTYLIGYADSFPGSKITVIGKSVPHLKDGAMSDFKNIMKECEYWEEFRWNTSNSEYRFGSGSVIQFRSIDKMGAHGPRRDVLFVNEANNIDRQTFEQLADRTKKLVIVDYNPSSRFWAHELVEEQPDRCSFLVLTYKDNEALSTTERANIEAHAPKNGEAASNWWTVYGLGQIGSLEGNVYSGWEEVDEEWIKEHGKLVRYGLDFGFNDQTAMTAIYEIEQGEDDKDTIPALGIVEKLYQSGIRGSEYVATLQRLKIDPTTLIVADAARPELIQDIAEGGFMIAKANKDAGSVLRGIDRVKSRRIFYCGKNLKSEYLSYAWKTDKAGNSLNVPQDGHDHLEDSLRYAVDDLDSFHFDM